MQYQATTPAQYITELASDWRKDKLLELRELILAQDTEIKESINYKMLCFRIADNDLFHLNAQQNYVSLYCGNTEKIDPQGKLLTGLNKGKGCIRFTKSKNINQTGIATFIKQAVLMAKQGEDLGC